MVQPSSGADALDGVKEEWPGDALDGAEAPLQCLFHLDRAVPEDEAPGHLCPVHHRLTPRDRRSASPGRCDDATGWWFRFGSNCPPGVPGHQIQLAVARKRISSPVAFSGQRSRSPAYRPTRSPPSSSVRGRQVEVMGRSRKTRSQSAASSDSAGDIRVDKFMQGYRLGLARPADRAPYEQNIDAFMAGYRAALSIRIKRRRLPRLTLGQKRCRRFSLQWTSTLLG